MGLGDLELVGGSSLTAGLGSVHNLTATLAGSSRLTAFETPQYEIVSAVAINPNTVLVTTFPPPNLVFPQLHDPSNWNIPGLTVQKVVASDDPAAVKVITSKQDYQSYDVTFEAATNTASFIGFSEVPRFSARAQGATSINIIFLQAMLEDAALSDPASYTLQTFDGTSITVQSATPNALSGPTRVILKIDLLTSGVPYSLTIGDVQTADGKPIRPNTAVILWHRTANRTSVPLSKFTGEVRATKSTEQALSETLYLHEALSVVLDPLLDHPDDPEAFHEVLTLQEGLTVVGSGFDSARSQAVNLSEEVTQFARGTFTNRQDSRSTIEVSVSEALTLKESLQLAPEIQEGLDPDVANLFGNPNGMVFFSPALKTGGAPNSAIQVDDVKACTQAYDSYTFPQPVDPTPLFTHGLGITPTPEVTTLNNAVLFVDFYRLKEAKHIIRDRPEDTVPAPTDIGVTITLKEVYPPSLVALLNNPAWSLFDNVGGDPPFVFITADNLAPLPAPVVAPTQHFVNPSEVLGLVETLSTAMSTSVAVNDTLMQSEDFDLVPGENVVQVNLSESLSISEGLETSIGINLSESMTIGEGLSTL